MRRVLFQLNDHDEKFESLSLDIFVASNNIMDF